MLAPVRSLVGDRELVQVGIAGEPPPPKNRIDPVVEIGRRLEARLCPEVPHIVLGSHAVAHVHRLSGARLVGELRKAQPLAELARKCALEPAQAELRWNRRPTKNHLAVAILAILFIGAEDEELVAHDRSTERGSRLPSLVGRLRKVTLSRKPVLCYEVFVLIEQEQIARPLIR